MAESPNVVTAKPETKLGTIAVFCGCESHAYTTNTAHARLAILGVQGSGVLGV